MQLSDKQKDSGSGHPSFDVVASGGSHHPGGSHMPPFAAAGPGAQGAGQPPFPFAFPPAPDPKDLIPVVISPPSESLQKQKQEQGKTGTTPIAFIFLPGAFLFPKDYTALAEELKTAFQSLSTDANISAWLVFAAIDWSKMNPMLPNSSENLFNNAIEEALHAAEEAGFAENNSLNPSGRLDNVFIGMHSVSVLAASGFAFHRAAGAILFGASMIATDTFRPSVHTYPRPLFHIFGEMDGQAHQCRAALSAAEAALSAPSLGRKAAARESPIALIEGMNHAQFSNCVINYTRGDLDPEKEQKVALQEIATVVAAFLTAHAPSQLQKEEEGEEEKKEEDKFQKAKEGAIDVLDDVTLRAARHFTPYLRALGRTAAEDLLICSEGACDTSACYGEDLATPLAYSYGAEYIPFTSSHLGAFTAHSGELHVAEKFAIRAQKQLLEAAGFSSEIVAGIPVAAVAHTSKESFTYSQPVILQCKDAPHGLVLKVHVLLQREAYPEKSGAAPAATAGAPPARSPTAALSPVYALKLKSAEQIAYAVKEMSTSIQPGELHHITAAKGVDARAAATAAGAGAAARLSAENYEEALVLVGARAREIFQKKRGCEVVFREDRRSGGGGGRPSGGGGGEKEEEGEKVKEAEHAGDLPRWETATDWIDVPLILDTSSPTAVATAVAAAAAGERQEYYRTASSFNITPSDSTSSISASAGTKMCIAVVPALHVPANVQGPYDEGLSRFAGAVYIKVPSLAWCMEWILVRGLRKRE